MIEKVSSIIPSIPVTGTEPVRSAQRQDAPKPEIEGGISKAAAESVEAALRHIEPPLLGQHERLSISRDEATGVFIYRSISRETGEVVRQWPVESMLQFKAYLRNAEGVLVDSRI